MSNPTFKTIDAAREYVEDYMEDFNGRFESRIAAKLVTRFSLPLPASIIDERELLNLISEELRKEIYD